MIDHSKFFKKITDAIVTIVLYVLLLALIAGMFRVLLDIRTVAIDSLDGGFNKIVTNVLTLFIVIEFFKTFADYSKLERIKLTERIYPHKPYTNQRILQFKVWFKAP